MKNKKILLSVLTTALILTLSLASCDKPPKSEPKTIVITGLGSSFSSSDIVIFTAGTPITDVANGIGHVAGASGNNSDIVRNGSDGSATYPLYNPGTNNGRWTGNGTYDVYWFYTTGVHNSSSNKYKIYKASVSFTEATTSVAFSKFADTGATEDGL
jgi:hypothetical protein